MARWTAVCLAVLTLVMPPPRRAAAPGAAGRREEGERRGGRLMRRGMTLEATTATGEASPARAACATPARARSGDCRGALRQRIARPTPPHAWHELRCCCRPPGCACGLGAPACVARRAPAPATRAAWAFLPALATQNSPRPPPPATQRMTAAGRQRPRPQQAPARAHQCGLRRQEARHRAHHARSAGVQPQSEASLRPATAKALHGAAAVRVDDVIYDEREAGHVQRSVRRGRSCPRVGMPLRSCPGRRPARGVSRARRGRPRGPRREHARTGQGRGACK